MSEICLISMPFGAIDWPSLGIGQLVAGAKRDGLDAKAVYPSIQFAEIIGHDWYKIISELLQAECLYGEWLFSQAAFEDVDIPQHDEFLDTFVKNSLFVNYMHKTFQKNEAFFVKELQNIRKKAREFVDRIAQEIVAEHPRIVGCSTSFQQYNASLALLRKIKHLKSSIITMLGGANCEAEIGWTTIKNIDWVDFVVSGEADSLFPKLCRKIFTYGTEIPVEEVPYGVYSKQKFSKTHQSLKRTEPEIAIEYDLNELPVPDYHDYFQALQHTTQKFEPVLSMETSRGCWKGQRQPCNFCGLNGNRVHYRKKSPERVLHELESLSQTYKVNTFLMTDTILHTNYFKDLLKELARRQAPYKFFFETISTLNEEQIKLLADAGVVKIQPGIENLHDELLKLLNKGNSTVQNIALLKFTLEKGIRVMWNLLTCVPGDCDTYYQEMAEFLPLLYHLSPPNFGILRFDRFSQYFQYPDKFGLTLSPLSVYQYIYPFEHDDLVNFAYFFQNGIKPSNSRGLKNVKDKIDEWKSLFYNKAQKNRPHLIFSEKENKMIIHDTRPCAIASEFILVDVEYLIYKTCRKPVTFSSLYQQVCSVSNNNSINEPVVEQALQQLIRKKLLLKIHGKYLALATLKPKKEDIIAPDRRVEFLMDKFVKRGTPTSHCQTDKTWEWLASLE